MRAKTLAALLLVAPLSACICITEGDALRTMARREAPPVGSQVTVSTAEYSISGTVKETRGPWLVIDVPASRLVMVTGGEVLAEEEQAVVPGFERWIRWDLVETVDVKGMEAD
jgi:hypothetical protein